MTPVLSDSPFRAQHQLPVFKTNGLLVLRISSWRQPRVCRCRAVSFLRESSPSRRSDDSSKWKHSRALVAVLVVSLSVVPSSSAAAALAEFNKQGATITSCEFAGEDVACGIDISKPEALGHPVKLANLSATVLSSGAAGSKVVHTMGAASIPKALPVRNTFVVSSSSRILARVLQHFGGGGIAGAIGAAIVYPLDTIKTRMQAQLSKDNKYKNEVDCFLKLVTEEGIGSLYSGLLPQLAGIAPEKAVKLTVNELLLEFLEHMMPGAGVWLLELIAGSCGGFSQVVFTNPVEIVKVKLQTQSKEPGSKKSMGQVVKELGVGGLYHGSGVTLARDIPSSAIFFACYAILKQLYPDQSFVDGCLAAIPATVVTHPMDVVKTRLQMEVPPGEVAHKDGWSCLRSAWREEGPRALFKGSVARVMRTSPQFGITLLLYSLLCGDSQH